MQKHHGISKIIIFLDNKAAKSLKLRKKNRVEKTDNVWETYNTNIQIKIKRTMFKSSLCDYSNGYILVKETISVPHTAVAREAANKTSKNSNIKKLRKK